MSSVSRLLRRRQRQHEQGQVLVLFAISMVVILAVGALLFSGAHGLVVRRQLQNASDAAALAAANRLIVNNGCSALGSGGAASAVVSAARNAVAANLPDYDPGKVVVTCPTGYNNFAVKVELSASSVAIFGPGLPVSASSVAVNGQVTVSKLSVVLLDPANPNWATGRDGCPSLLINGGIGATFEGSVMLNSTCTLAQSSAGAMNTNGSSAAITFLDNGQLMLAGEYNRRISVNGTTPLENVRPLVPDPLSGLIELPTYIANGSVTLPRVTLGTICTGTNRNPCILTPGIYNGGLSPSGGAGRIFALRPGVYYLEGGGFNVGATSFYSIPDTAILTDAQVRVRYATALLAEVSWPIDCPFDPNGNGHCGVFIYNAPSCTTCTWSLPNGDRIVWSATGQTRLRAYVPGADRTNGAALLTYQNLVIWQARTPAPSPSSPQPVIDVSGGRQVTLSGTVYASGAEVDFGGTSTGTGGGTDTRALQFIAWDLHLQGDNNMYFEYRDDAFARPTKYGLVE